MVQRKKPITLFFMTTMDITFFALNHIFDIGFIRLNPRIKVLKRAKKPDKIPKNTQMFYKLRKASLILNGSIILL